MLEAATQQGESWLIAKLTGEPDSGVQMDRQSADPVCHVRDIHVLGVAPLQSLGQAVHRVVQRVPCRDKFAVLVVVGHDAILAQAGLAGAATVMSGENVHSCRRW